MCRKLAISWTAVALALGVPQAMAGDASTEPTTASRNLPAGDGTLLAFPSYDETVALTRAAASQH